MRNHVQEVSVLLCKALLEHSKARQDVKDHKLSAIPQDGDNNGKQGKCDLVRRIAKTPVKQNAKKGMDEECQAAASHVEICRFDLLCHYPRLFWNTPRLVKMSKIIISAPFLKKAIITANKESVIWFDG
jgi:hypothetical protein